MTGEYRHSLPLIPLNGIVVFPNMITSFPVGREKSLNALNKASREYKTKLSFRLRKKYRRASLKREIYTGSEL